MMSKHIYCNPPHILEELLSSVMKGWFLSLLVIQFTTISKYLTGVESELENSDFLQFVVLYTILKMYINSL